MSNTFFSCVLAILLSLSVSGPSLIALLENDVNVEIVQDFDEESNNEIKIDIEEADKYFEEQTSLAMAQISATHTTNFFYQDKVYAYSPDVNAPPPRS